MWSVSCKLLDCSTFLRGFVSTIQWHNKRSYLFFWSMAPSYEVVAFVLKSADYALVLWHLFLFHYNSFTIVWFTVFNIRYSFNPLYSSTRMESIKVCLRSVTIVVLLLDWWFILPFDEITLADEELVEVELGEVGILENK